MGETLVVFIAGMSGVFLGMALLYFSIKIMTAVTGRISESQVKK